MARGMRRWHPHSEEERRMLPQVNADPGPAGALSTSLHGGSGRCQPWEQPSLATAPLHPGLSASSARCGFAPSADAQQGTPRTRGSVPSWVSRAAPWGGTEKGHPAWAQTPFPQLPCSEGDTVQPCPLSLPPESNSHRQPRAAPASPSSSPELGAALGSAQTSTTGRELRAKRGIKWNYSSPCLPPSSLSPHAR